MAELAMDYYESLQNKQTGENEQSDCEEAINEVLGNIPDTQKLTEDESDTFRSFLT
jgi:hypothetical protein